MPQVFKVGSYWVYFWANENEPLEPVHVHIAEGAPIANGTKIWITKAGKCLLCNNASKIPDRVLRNINGSQKQGNVSSAIMLPRYRIECCGTSCELLRHGVLKLWKSGWASLAKRRIIADPHGETNGRN